MAIPYYMLVPLGRHFGNKISSLNLLFSRKHKPNDAISIEEFTKICVELDEKVGKHWPILASRVWKPSSLPLISAYFNSSQNCLMALKGLFELDGVVLQVLLPKMHILSSGLQTTLYPDEGISDRVFEILQIFVNLAFFGMLKGVPDFDVTKIELNLPFKRAPYYDVFEKLLGCTVTYENEDHFAFYPMEVLLLPFDGYNDQLNSILFEQLKVATDREETKDVYYQVYAAVSKDANLDQSIADFCKSFGVSERTLQRKLRTEGSSYTLICDDVFREQLPTLISRGLSQSEVAEYFGLKNSASLSARTRRIFGVSYRDYRINPEIFKFTPKVEPK